MNIIMYRFIQVLLFIFVCLFLNMPAEAAELSIPAARGQAGEQIELPVMLDKVEDLAGVKIALKYDAAILTYLQGNKTKQTESLMHVVNDKKPGQLIIVMAGARGIKGENFPIFKMTFELNQGLKEPVQTRLEITEVQLMSEKLKDIPHSLSIGFIEIEPAKTGQAEPEK